MRDVVEISVIKNPECVNFFFEFSMLFHHVGDKKDFANTQCHARHHPVTRKSLWLAQTTHNAIFTIAINDPIKAIGWKPFQFRYLSARLRRHKALIHNGRSQYPIRIGNRLSKVKSVSIIQSTLSKE